MDSRERFTVLMAQDPQAIALDEAALLVAAEEYPSLESRVYQERLDEMGRVLADRVVGELEPERLAAVLSDHLFGRLGFRGNVGDYYDPRNSFLNEVLDRRVGIPITLSIVYVALGTRLGLPLAGVSFPGHFIVVYRAAPQPFFLDPFNQGRRLSETDFRLLALEQFGPGSDFNPALLRPATPMRSSPACSATSSTSTSGARTSHGRSAAASGSCWSPRRRRSGATWGCCSPGRGGCARRCRTWNATWRRRRRRRIGTASSPT